jgi:hypothetical protein
MTGNVLRKLRQGLRHAFSLEGPYGPLTDRDRRLLERLAHAIVIRGMGTPAILFLGSVRPLNSIGSQAMVFLRPFLTPLLFNQEDYDGVAAILERREGIDALMDAIEEEQGLERGRRA